ncbi:hypothetical protein FisN_26Lh123 [Fistulifera solaris]|uniref:Uncharacterized protein n=1 Tax=Fistulifera solaris TaxID=1519565 RepID=A0A1Z5KD52_FISSO|nr:hypothetical protein FisN_26Lh123 [Fistulifera solaris]|eukprot:GAX24052.1 hypothetical protein FisN_26Lh123 [Fistulifera solaris]
MTSYSKLSILISFFILALSQARIEGDTQRPLSRWIQNCEFIRPVFSGGDDSQDDNGDYSEDDSEDDRANTTGVTN